MSFMKNPSLQFSGQTPLGSYVCLALAMLLTGIYVALCKPLGAGIPVFLLALLRFSMAALAVPHWLLPADGARPLSSRTWRLLFLQSFFGNFIFTICMIFGLQMTTALSAGIILACIPASIATLSAVFLREKISPKMLASIALGVGGLALLAGATREHAGASGAKPWLGNLLILVAVFCEAAYVIIGKKLSDSISPRRVAALINVCGLALFMLPGLYQAYDFDFGRITPWLWLLLAFYALTASVICVWLWMTGLRHVPATQSGIFTVLMPVGAVLTGVIFLGENLSGMHLVALTLALSGLVLATWRPMRADAIAAQ